MEEILILKVTIEVLQKENGSLRLKVSESHGLINYLTVMGVMDESKRLVLKSLKQPKKPKII